MNKAGGQFPPNFCPSGGLQLMFYTPMHSYLYCLMWSCRLQVFLVRNLHCFVQLAVRLPPTQLHRGVDDRPKQHDVNPQQPIIAKWMYIHAESFNFMA